MQPRPLNNRAFSSPSHFAAFADHGCIPGRVNGVSTAPVSSVRGGHPRRLLNASETQLVAEADEVVAHCVLVCSFHRSSSMPPGSIPMDVNLALSMRTICRRTLPSFPGVCSRIRSRCTARSWADCLLRSPSAFFSRPSGVSSLSSSESTRLGGLPIERSPRRSLGIAPRALASSSSRVSCI